MRTSLKEKIYIADRLRDLLTIPEDGFCSYPEGWSDQALADEATQELGAGVSVNAVAYIRQELFGKVRKQVKRPLAARIEALEVRVLKLEELLK